MKKWISLLAALMLLLGCAMAEETPAAEAAVTRTVVVGEAESAVEMVETLFESADGYSFWYQAEVMEPGVKYNHDVFVPVGAAAEESEISFLIVPAEIDAEQADGMLAEAVGGYTGEYVLTKYENVELENGVVIGSVQVEQEGIITRFYIIRNEHKALCVTATYPAANAEDMGAAFERLSQTVEFAAAEEKAE